MRWIEEYLLLPLRWWRVNLRAKRELRQRCKVCGCRDKFNFDVPDDVWRAVVPRQFQNRVVCLACFDDFAEAKGIPYRIGNLCFAGKQKSCEFIEG